MKWLAGLVGAVMLAVLAPPAQATAPPSTGCPDPAPGYVQRAPGRGRTVALTFDDGPSRFTPQVLAVLKRFGVRATFFQTGLHDSQHRRWARMTAADGHLLGDHTWHHRTPAELEHGWTAAYLRRELASTQRLQRRLSGRPVCFMRPPGGHKAPALLPTAHALGMSVVEWSVGTDDWAGPPARSLRFTRLVVRNAAVGLSQRHPIVLLHDGKASHEPADVVSDYRGNTVAALPRIIRTYQAAGYTFVGLDGLTAQESAQQVATPAEATP